MLTPIDRQRLLASGMMSYAPAVVPPSPAYGTLDAAILADLNAQKTKKEIMEELGVERIWSQQLSVKQIAAKHGVQPRDVYNLQYRKIPVPV